jgi:hypothetical protein
MNCNFEHVYTSILVEIGKNILNIYAQSWKIGSMIQKKKEKILTWASAYIKKVGILKKTLIQTKIFNKRIEKSFY